jgi:hypothetical protein
MDDQLPAILAGVIHSLTTNLEATVRNQAAGVLTNQPSGDTPNLWEQLTKGDGKIPKGLNLQFLGLQALDLPNILQPDHDPLDLLQALLHKPVNDLKRLFAAKNPAEALAISKTLIEEKWTHLVQDVAPFIGAQFGLLLSLLTTWKNLPTKETAESVREALLQYFFTREGYNTVDGTQLVAPVHLSDLDLQQTGQIKAFLSERTAERYVRDLIRVLSEAADKIRYDQLDKRYKAMQGFVPADKQTKFVDWFRGIASAAESAVMGAVEEAVLGVSQFQTNPLIAASASTFAGVAARKAAQHVFLSELEQFRLRQ